jgi:DNA alkylation repair enzyme
MGKPRVPIDPVADLRRRLAHADRTRLSTCVHGWWADHGFADHPTIVGKRVALALLEQPLVDAKLAAILILQEQLGAHLRASDLSTFARLFARGYLADATVVDWFSLKVLATLLASDRSDRTDRAGRCEVARALAQWRSADTAWQRRAACVAFTRLASSGDAALPGITDTIFTICATVVWSHERTDQTAVGWVLRELSRAEPERVAAFFTRHALLMSRECARHATAKYAPEQRKQLLAHHRRVTSLQ